MEHSEPAAGGVAERAASRIAGETPRPTRRSARLELELLVVLALGAIAMFTFVELAGLVREGHSLAFDRTLLLAMRTPGDLADPVGPPGFEETARDFTALGSLGVLAIVAGAVVGYLLITRRLASAVLVLAATGGGALVSTLLKNAFHRTRPELVPHAVHVYTASFPSGHAMLSAVTYLTLGALLMRLHESRLAKAYVMGVAALLTLLVGVSRVYLGVHWPSDVLAGWCVGACWALACWSAALWLQRRGQSPRASRFSR